MLCVDSPSVPPSATAREIFRGFSYIAPVLMTDEADSGVASSAVHNLQQSGQNLSLVYTCFHTLILLLFVKLLCCKLYVQLISACVGNKEMCVAVAWRQDQAVH